MKHQYLELLSGIGFAPPDMDMRDLSRKARSCGGDAVLEATGPEVNANGSNYKLVVSVLCAALYPNIVQSLTPELKYKATASGAVLAPHTASEIKFKTKTDGYVHIHPSSVNAQCAHYENPYLVYHEKIKTSRVFIRELSMVPLYPMILFGKFKSRVSNLGPFSRCLPPPWDEIMTTNKNCSI
jgi:ATP-dependent RNA helicase DHX57